MVANAIENAKRILVKPYHFDVKLSNIQQSIQKGNCSLQALPTLLSLGNQEVNEMRLLTVKCGLRTQGIKDGYLVFNDEGDVKYYNEDYSFTALHVATFTNFPVYAVMINDENQ